MKKLTLITALLLAFSVSALSQTTMKESEGSDSGRIALANQTKDTLYVVKPMVELFTTIWSDPSYKNERPTIISVKTIDPYALKMGISLKAVMD